MSKAEIERVIDQYLNGVVPQPVSNRLEATELEFSDEYPSEFELAPEFEPAPEEPIVKKNPLDAIRRWQSTKRIIDEFQVQLARLEGKRPQVGDKLIPIIRELESLQTRVDNVSHALQGGAYTHQDVSEYNRTITLLENVSNKMAVSLRQFRDELAPFAGLIRLEQKLADLLAWLPGFVRGVWRRLRNFDRMVAELEKRVFFSAE